jgi:uncharacterized damage-inducible protein DinB
MQKNKLFLSISLMLMAFNFAKAQTHDQMIKDWERAKLYTKEYLDSMPEEGYMLKPTPEMRTFAEEMIHLGGANYIIGSIASGTKSPVELGDLAKISDKSKAATTKLVMDSYDFIINAIKTMKPEQFSSNVKVFGHEMTAAVALSKAFEHQTHMRGQVVAYLHLEGVKVPAEKLF